MYSTRLASACCGATAGKPGSAGPDHMNIIDLTLDMIGHILSFCHARDQKSFFDTCQVVRSYEEHCSVRWCFTSCLHDAIKQYLSTNDRSDPVVLFIFGMYDGWLKTFKKKGYHIATQNYWCVMYFLDAFTRGLIAVQNEKKAPRRLSYLRTRYMLPDHGQFFATVTAKC